MASKTSTKNVPSQKKVQHSPSCVLSVCSKLDKQHTKRCPLTFNEIEIVLLINVGSRFLIMDLSLSKSAYLFSKYTFPGTDRKWVDVASSWTPQTIMKNYISHNITVQSLRGSADFPGITHRTANQQKPLNAVQANFFQNLSHNSTSVCV